MTGQREVPALPPEPPNLAVVEGRPIYDDIWQRDDEPNADGNAEKRWWCVGIDDSYTWTEALAQGADPARRLVVVDPTDEAQVGVVADSLVPLLGSTDGDRRQFARVALRALVEEQP